MRLSWAANATEYGIKKNYWLTGSSCKEAANPNRLSHSNREEMMRHPIYRVQSFEKLTPYTLRIRFDDDTERTIDFRPILAGELYGPLRDPVVFNQVQIDPEVHTLVWPNGADFDPATLHDWPQHCDAFIARAREWEPGAGREQESA
jgi:hypothetical protein